MALATPFTELVGCPVPIQSAAMGSDSSRLAIAVARAGGLGMLSAAPLSLEQLRANLLEGASIGPGAVGVNFLMPFLGDDAAIELAAQHARVIEFFYGEPDLRLVRLARSHGAVVAWQVGSVAEALAARDAGCDFIIVQGVEAGGHVRGMRGLLTMMADVLDSVSCPIVAAGGIATPRAFAAALSAGASAVRMGTRFVASQESDFHPDYIKALTQADGEEAVYTNRFSVGWDAPHRVLEQSICAAEALDDGVVAKIDVRGRQIEVPRFSAFTPVASATGQVAAMLPARSA